MASGSPRSSGGGIAQLIGQFNAVPDLEPEPEPAALAPSESSPAPGSVAELLQRVESDDAALSELDLSDVATYQVHAAANTRALAHGLRTNTSLTVIALEGCEITDESALALAEAVVVMPTFYLQLPLAAMFGFFLFGQVPDIWLVPGAALIIGGSYYSLWSEARRRPARKEGSPEE